MFVKIEKMPFFEICVFSGVCTGVILKKYRNEYRTLLMGESLKDGARIDILVPSVDRFLELKDSNQDHKSHTIAQNTTNGYSLYNWFPPYLEINTPTTETTYRLETKKEWTEFLGKNRLDTNQLVWKPSVRFPLSVKEIQIPRQTPTYSISSYKILGTDAPKLARTALFQRTFIPLLLTSFVGFVSGYKFLQEWRSYNECAYKKQQMNLFQYTLYDIQKQYRFK